MSSAGAARWRPWVAAAALAATVIAIVASLLLSRGARALTNQDTIVLADFTNTTGEPVFDGTLKVALAVALEQSPFLKVFPDDRVRETLRLMQRAPDERITRAIARDIARREQLKALVAGSIGTARQPLRAGARSDQRRDRRRHGARAGGGGRPRSRSSRRSAKPRARLREKLGESLASIERFDVPLPQATTPSLEALHAYSLALDQGRMLPRAEAIPHLKRAIELDPEFRDGAGAPLGRLRQHRTIR